MPSKNLCFAWTGYIWYHVGSPLDIPMLNLSSDPKTNWESLFWTAMSWAFQSIQMASSKAACCFPPFWVRLSAPTCRCASAEHMYACCSPWASCSAGTLKQPTISHHYEQVLWAWQWCVIVSMKNAVVVCSGVEIGGLHALSAHVHTRFDCQQRSVSWISGILEVFRAQVRCLEASLKLPSSSLHLFSQSSLHQGCFSWSERTADLCRFIDGVMLLNWRDT